MNDFLISFGPLRVNRKGILYYSKRPQVAEIDRLNAFTAPTPDLGLLVVDLAQTLGLGWEYWTVKKVIALNDYPYN